MELMNGNNTIDIEVVDRFGFTYHESKTLIIGNEGIDDEATIVNPNGDPIISIMNPKGKSISLYEGDTANVRFQVSVSTANREIVLSIDNKPIQTSTS